MLIDELQSCFRTVHTHDGKSRKYYDIDSVNRLILADESYWKKRCLAAEKYISESPCDPDIYDSQLKAYHRWQKIKGEQ